MSRKIWRRPNTCDCHKISYADEAAATAHIDARRDHYGDDAYAYRCTGATCWHVSTSGVLLESLRGSAARSAAWVLCRTGRVDVTQLAREQFGIGLDTARGQRWCKKRIRPLVRAGIAAWAPAEYDVLLAVDRDALLRVVRVGLDEYLAAVVGA